MGDATCIECDERGGVYTFRLEPPAETAHGVLDRVSLRRVGREIQVWADGTPPQRIICYSGLNWEPGVAQVLRDWGGYTETAASRMRRELKAVGADALPIVVHLQPYWDDLSEEARLVALIVTRHWEQRLRFPPDADIRDARIALRRLDRALSDLLGGGDDEGEDDDVDPDWR